MSIEGTGKDEENDDLSSLSNVDDNTSINEYNSPVQVDIDVSSVNNVTGSFTEATSQDLVDASVAIKDTIPDHASSLVTDVTENKEDDVASEEEEDIVIRPRSRSKRTNMTSEEEDEVVKRNRLEVPSVLEDVSGTIEASVQPPSNDDDDAEGNTKVDADGALIGDRTYTSKAFRLPTRGDTYYFLATEIARISGYRDSYLLFNKNRNLKKLMTTEAEKAHLIQQELLPYSYRNRQIGVVKALSIYKTFGAKVINKGKRVKDDYFAQRARDQGFTEEDFANEEDRPVEDRLYAQAEAQRRADTEAEIVLANNAKSAVDYNTMLNQQRKERESARRKHFQNPNIAVQIG